MSFATANLRLFSDICNYFDTFMSMKYGYSSIDFGCSSLNIAYLDLSKLEGMRCAAVVGTLFGFLQNFGGGKPPHPHPCRQGVAPLHPPTHFFSVGVNPHTPARFPKWPFPAPSRARNHPPNDLHHPTQKKPILGSYWLGGR